jgi:hypothetical protein
VNVRFGHVRDAQSFRAREVEIRRRVAQWVDDDGLAGRLASDQIARLGERFIVQFAK